MDARAVGEPGVDERLREVDPAAERRDEALDEHEDLLGIAEPDRRGFDATVALDPDPAGAVDHHLAHAIVAKERRELAEAEESVVEIPLERPQLAGREGDAFGRCGLAEQRTELVPARPAIGALAQPEEEGLLEALAGGAHVASIESSSPSSSYARPRAPPIGPRRDSAAATAGSSRGRIRNAPSTEA